MVADEAALAGQWPAFYAELVANTPIRGIVSLPLDRDQRDFGALDLYVVPPRGTGVVTVSDALAVSAEITRIFQEANAPGPGSGEEPAWLDAPAVQRRAAVWQAMGFLNAGLRINSPDALALLRAHAYAQGISLDRLAQQVLDRTAPVEDFALDPDPR